MIICPHVKKQLRKWEEKQTDLESGRGDGTFGVAVVQWDDGDDVLGVDPQVRQCVVRGVAGQFHRLYVLTFG